MTNNNANVKPYKTIEVVKGSAETVAITVNGEDLTASTVKFRVYAYDGASASIDKTCSKSLSGSNTICTAALTSSDLNLGFSRGIYHLEDTTTEDVKLVGEFYVRGWGS